MILILIAMIIGIGIAVFQTYNGRTSDFIDYIFPSFVFIHYIFSSFVGIVVGAVIGLIVAIMLPVDTYDKHYSLNIETLQDNNSVSGNFFLGCGLRSTNFQINNNLNKKHKCQI